MTDDPRCRYDYALDAIRSLQRFCVTSASRENVMVLLDRADRNIEKLRAITRRTARVAAGSTVTPDRDAPIGEIVQELVDVYTQFEPHVRTVEAFLQTNSPGIGEIKHIYHASRALERMYETGLRLEGLIELMNPDKAPLKI